MTRTLISLTARQLLGRRRWALIALGALLPVGFALLYRLAGDASDPAADVTGTLDALVVALLLPLGALVFGTAALGAEIEDGTAVYLLAKPVARWRILAAKVAVAAAATIALTVPATLATALIGMDGDRYAIAPGFAAGVAAGAVVYSALFVGLSAITSRALIAGLVYVFVWEAFVTSLFDGTRWISVRQYALGIAGEISTAPPDVFDANLGGLQAAAASVAVVVAAFALGVRSLRRFEIGERP